jgi:hypothetical protein
VLTQGEVMIISISGLAGSGKDTIGNMLIKKHNFTRVAMADILKEMCSKVTKLALNYFHAVDLKDSNLDPALTFDAAMAASLAFELNQLGYDVTPSKFNSLLGEQLETPRKILIFIGTDLCRNMVESSIGLDLTEKKIKAVQGSVVITDARFQNERDAIKKMGGIKMFVDRPSVSEKFNAPMAHESELNQLMDSYDVYVINDSTVSRLEIEVDMWYNTKVKHM